MTSFDEYLKRLGSLKRSGNRSLWSAATLYAAPYKPLLLLSVFDLVEQGVIGSNLIELSPELSELFALYCSQVLPQGMVSNIGMPFFHLSSEGFWHLIPKPGVEEAELLVGSGKNTVSQLHKFFLGAKFDQELFELIRLKEAREAFRKIVIEKYFAPQVGPALWQQSRINMTAFDYSQDLLEKPGQNHKIEEKLEGPQEYVKQVRDQAFRKAIVRAYEHRCAICGLRVVTAEGHTAVAAAHIIPWSVSHNDNVTNGMALCHLCHWAFDEGVASVSKKYTVLASEQLTSGNNAPGIILMVRDRPIFRPGQEDWWPELTALEWHRTNVFKRL